MVFVLGGAQTDFARNWAREDARVEQIVGEVIDAVVADAGIEHADIGAIHVGNAFGELFTGQAQMGALPATARPALWGVPASRHEAACASGSIAILSAMADIEAGRYDCVLVLGIEQERNVPGDVGARHMGAAAWVGHEGLEARYPWPYMFSRIAEEYDARWGLSHDHLAAIAKKNLAAAKSNPLAQTRGWTWTDATLDAGHPDNKVVEGRLHRYDCAQVTDGCAAVILASPAFARGRKAPRIAGWGHRTAALGLDAKLARTTDPTQPLFPHLQRTVIDALSRANLPDARALGGIEVHDCFTITEYMIIDHLGLTAPGEAWREVERPSLALNPSGGLIGGGHPVGATGVRMLVDAARQVAGRAGAVQIDGVQTFGTLNIGGSGTTAVSFVVAAA